MKKQNKKHQNAKSIDKKLKTTGLMLHFFHVICKISNFSTYVKRKASPNQLNVLHGHN